MEQEILNIEYHKKRLVLKALNLVSSMPYAASKLGISVRNLYRLMDDYNIVYEKKDGKRKYFIKEKTKVIAINNIQHKKDFKSNVL